MAEGVEDGDELGEGGAKADDFGISDDSAAPVAGNDAGAWLGDAEAWLGDGRTKDDEFGDGGVNTDEFAYGHPNESTYQDALPHQDASVQMQSLWSMESYMQYWQENNEFSMQWRGANGASWPGVAFSSVDIRGAQRQRDCRPGRQKRRFCTSFPEVSSCHRGEACAFAHSRDEVNAPLLDNAEEKQDLAALSDEFLMFKYKTLWCPRGVQHEWHTCVYAHNYQDARRPVSIGYGPRLCPYWRRKDTCSEYFQRCPLGLRCPFAHGAKEQLYHPQDFKRVTCRDLRNKVCPRHRLCAFFHHRAERRTPPADDVDYSQPLPEEELPKKWVTEFLSPPFTSENGYRDDQSIPDPGESAISSYSAQDTAQYATAMFFSMPANDVNSSYENQSSMGQSMMPEPSSHLNQQSLPQDIVMQ